jgi:hypothetical protein
MIKTKQVAIELGSAEESLYLELIHEGLLAREQWLYMEKLKNLSSSVSQDEILALLDKAPDSEALAADKMPNPLS